MNASAVAAFGEAPFLDKGGATAVAIGLFSHAQSMDCRYASFDQRYHRNNIVVSINLLPHRVIRNSIIRYDTC